MMDDLRWFNFPRSRTVFLYKHFEAEEGKTAHCNAEKIIKV
jgi:hypothetical protein